MCLIKLCLYVHTDMFESSFFDPHCFTFLSSQPQQLCVESVASCCCSFVVLSELMASFHRSPPAREPVTPPNKQPSGLITAAIFVWDPHRGCWDSWKILLHFHLYSHRVADNTDSAHGGRRSKNLWNGKTTMQCERNLNTNLVIKELQLMQSVSELRIGE